MESADGYFNGPVLESPPLSAETSLGGSNVRFPATLWTSVLRAQSGRGEALERLIRIYWKPVYFFIRRRGHSVEDAKDYTQTFFTVFLERDFLRSVDRRKGRFRTFVIAALTHFLSNEYRAERARKRGGGRAQVPFEEVELRLSSREDSPEIAFDREWGVSLVEEALSRLRGEDGFEVLSPYVMHPTRSYAEPARRLGIGEKAVARKVRSLRARLRAILQGLIQDSVETREDFADELKHFARIFEGRAS